MNQNEKYSHLNLQQVALLQRAEEEQFHLHSEAVRKEMDMELFIRREEVKRDIAVKKAADLLALREDADIRKELQFIEVTQDMNGRLCIAVVRDPARPGKRRVVIAEECRAAKRYQVIFPQKEELLVVTFVKNGSEITVRFPLSGEANKGIAFAKEMNRCGIYMKVSTKLYKEVCDALYAFLEQKAEVEIIPLTYGYTLLTDGGWHLVMPGELTMEVVKNGNER